MYYLATRTLGVVGVVSLLGGVSPLKVQMGKEGDKEDKE